MKDQEKNKGWYKKYIINKTDESLMDKEADYFVIRLDKDKHSRIAALAYAESIELENSTLANDLRERVKYYRNMNIFLYVLNEDGVKEYIIASNKKEAVEFAGSIWGADCLQEYIDEYLKDNPGDTIDDFIEEFAKQMPMDETFKLETESGIITKMIIDWVYTNEESPRYFGCENY